MQTTDSRIHVISIHRALLVAALVVTLLAAGGCAGDPTHALHSTQHSS